MNDLIKIYNISKYLKNVKLKENSLRSDCPFCSGFNSFSYSESTKEKKGKWGVFQCFKCNETGNGIDILIFFDKLNFSDNLKFLDSENNKTTFSKINQPERKITNKSEEKIYKNVTKRYFKNWEYNFYIKDRDGNINYIKQLYYDKTIPSQNGKFKKKFNIDRKIKNPYESNIFYGLEKIPIKCEILFIVEGEKKCDKLNDSLKKYFPTRKFSSISATCGSKHLIGNYTLSVLRDVKPKMIVLLPDLDVQGKEFVTTNHSILLKEGFNSYVFNFKELIIDEKKLFKGYDIEDALLDNEDIYINNLIQGCDEDYLKFIQSQFYWSGEEKKIKIDTPYLNKIFNFSYIYDILIRKKSPIFIIESLQGTGKTSIIEEFLYKKAKLLVISSRVGVCKDISNKFPEITFYKKIIDDENNKGISPSDYDGLLSVCIDSITYFEYISKNISDYVVILDEVDSIFKSILIKERDIKLRNKKSILFSFMNNIIMSSKVIIGMSADIPNYLLNYFENKSLIESNTNQFYHIENKFKDNKNFFKYNNLNELLKYTIDSLNNNIKIVISINRNYKHILKIKKLLESNTNNKKGLLIGKEKNEETINIMEKKDFSDYDYIIFTPTIFTGIDFNVPFADKHIMIIDNNKSTDHYECLQSCYRFRSIKEVHYFIKKVNGNNEIELNKISKKCLTNRDFQKFGDYSGNPDLLMIDLYSKIKAARNQSLNNLSKSFDDLVKNKNSKQITIIDSLKKSYEINYKYINKEIKDEIIASPVINKYRLNKINKGGLLINDESPLSIEKSEIYNLLKFRCSNDKLINILTNKYSYKIILKLTFNNKLLLSNSNQIQILQKIENQTDLENPKDLYSIKNSFERILLIMCPKLESITFENLLNINYFYDEQEGKKNLLYAITKDDTLNKLTQLKSKEPNSFIQQFLNSTLGWNRVLKYHKTNEKGKRERSYKINEEILSVFLYTARDELNKLPK